MKLSLIDSACKLGNELHILYPIVQGTSKFSQWGYNIVGNLDSLVASIKAKRVDEFLDKLTRVQQVEVRAIVVHYQPPLPIPLILWQVMRQIFSKAFNSKSFSIVSYMVFRSFQEFPMPSRIRLGTG